MLAQTPAILETTLHRFTALPQVVQTTGEATVPGDPSATYMTLYGHTGEINSVEFSRDGQYIVTGSDDRSVRIWDTQTYSQVGDALTGHTDAVKSACFSPDGTLVVSASRDGTVCIWNAQSQAHEQVGESFTGHPDVEKAQFLASGKQVVSASFRTILFWDAVTHAQIAEPFYSRGSIFAISPDGNCIALRTAEHVCLEIHNIQTGAQVGQRLSGHSGWLESVVFSPDGQCIATSANDDTIRLWDANTGAPIDAINGPQNTRHISFFPDGRHIMVCTGHRFIQRLTEFWDLKTHSRIRQDLSSKISDLASFSSLSPDGNQFASVSKDLHSIRLWSSEAPVNNSTSTDNFKLNSASYSPDGKSIITACSDYAIRTWDAETYSQTGKTPRRHAGWVYNAIFSPDGNLIVSGSSNGTLCVWSAETGTQIGGPLTGHTGRHVSIAFSPDGTCFASTDGPTIRVWSAERSDLGKLIQAFKIPHPKRRWAPLSISFSSQGQFIAVNVESLDLLDTDTYVLDLKTGTESSVIPSQYQHSSACFSPTKHLILSFGGTDHSLHLWNVEAHCIEMVFSGHASTVRKASFSSDGKHIVSASMDHTICVWDTGTGSQTAKYLNLSRFYSGPANLRTIEISPDGRRILSVYTHHSGHYIQILAMPGSLPPDTNVDYSVNNPNVCL